jgi:predicted TIM-barrel fold metal-dependent hydrolase
MIIDWQHHLSPEAISQKRGGKVGQAVIEKGMVGLYIREEVYSVDMQLEYMDETGIDISVVSATLRTLEDCKLTDDFYAKVMKEHPKRFVGLAPCIPTKGDEALKELERALDMGLKGIVISPQNDVLPLDDKKMWPFYELVSRRNVPIFLHITNTPVGYDALLAPYNLNITLTREFDLVAAVARMILGGVMAEFPDLTWVVAHMGGGIAVLLDRLETWVDLLQERFWTDSGGTPPFGAPFKENFRKYFDTLYFDMAGCGGETNAVKAALTAINPDKLVFGTDYPYEFSEDPQGVRDYMDKIRRLDLPSDAIDGMLGLNAARLLGL